MIAHVFGKDGCVKCAVLQRRLAQLMEKDEYIGTFGAVYHDCLDENELVTAIQLNLNLSKIPAIVMGDGKSFMRYTWGRDRLDGDRSVVGGWLGLSTDYSDQHRGVITAAMIEELIRLGLRLQTGGTDT